MKDLIIIIGTILLGVVIVSTLVLGGDGTLQGASSDLVEGGITKITSIF